MPSRSKKPFQTNAMRGHLYFLESLHSYQELEEGLLSLDREGVLGTKDWLSQSAGSSFFLRLP